MEVCSPTPSRERAIGSLSEFCDDLLYKTLILMWYLAQKDLRSTHQPWPSYSDEYSSQQVSTLGPAASPTFDSHPRRRKRSPAVTDQRNDRQEAMSQTLNTHMVPTKPPKRRRLTQEERLRVAHVRKMKACPSCRQKHQKVQKCVLDIHSWVAHGRK